MASSPATIFHENLPIGSKVISEGYTDSGNLISLFSFLESRLQRNNGK
jgi:hypothetical protein